MLRIKQKQKTTIESRTTELRKIKNIASSHTVISNNSKILVLDGDLNTLIHHINLPYKKSNQIGISSLSVNPVSQQTSTNNLKRNSIENNSNDLDYINNGNNLRTNVSNKNTVSSANIFIKSIDLIYLILCKNTKFQEYIEFHKIDDYTLKNIFKKITYVCFEEGEFIYKQGTLGKAFYGIIEGNVDITENKKIIDKDMVRAVENSFKKYTHHVDALVNDDKRALNNNHSSNNTIISNNEIEVNNNFINNLFNGINNSNNANNVMLHSNNSSKLNSKNNIPLLNLSSKGDNKEIFNDITKLNDNKKDIDKTNTILDLTSRLNQVKLNQKGLIRIKDSKSNNDNHILGYKDNLRSKSERKSKLKIIIPISEEEDMNIVTKSKVDTNASNSKVSFNAKDSLIDDKAKHSNNIDYSETLTNKRRVTNKNNDIKSPSNPTNTNKIIRIIKSTLKNNNENSEVRKQISFSNKNKDFSVSDSFNSLVNVSIPNNKASKFVSIRKVNNNNLYNTSNKCLNNVIQEENLDINVTIKTNAVNNINTIESYTNNNIPSKQVDFNNNTKNKTKNIEFNTTMNIKHNSRLSKSVNHSTHSSQTLNKEELNNDNNNNYIKIKQITKESLISGSCFGEKELLSKRPRVYNAIAKTKTHIWKLDVDEFNKFLKPVFKKSQEEKKNFLKYVLFSKQTFLSQKYIDILFNNVQFEYYHKNDVVYFEKEEIKKHLYIIHSGLFSLKKNTRYKNVVVSSINKDVLSLSKCVLKSRGDVCGLEVLDKYKKQYDYSLFAEKNSVLYKVLLKKLPFELENKIKTSLDDVYNKQKEFLDNRMKQIEIVNKNTQVVYKHENVFDPRKSYFSSERYLVKKYEEFISSEIPRIYSEKKFRLKKELVLNETIGISTTSAADNNNKIDKSKINSKLENYGIDSIDNNAIGIGGRCSSAFDRRNKFGSIRNTTISKKQSNVINEVIEDNNKSKANNTLNTINTKDNTINELKQSESISKKAKIGVKNKISLKANKLIHLSNKLLTKNTKTLNYINSNNNNIKQTMIINKDNNDLDSSASLTLQSSKAIIKSNIKTDDPSNAVSSIINSNADNNNTNKKVFINKELNKTITNKNLVSINTDTIDTKNLQSNTKLKMTSNNSNININGKYLYTETKAKNINLIKNKIFIERPNFFSELDLTQYNKIQSPKAENNNTIHEKQHSHNPHLSVERNQFQHSKKTSKASNKPSSRVSIAILKDISKHNQVNSIINTSSDKDINKLRKNKRFGTMNKDISLYKKNLLMAIFETTRNNKKRGSTYNVNNTNNNINSISNSPKKHMRSNSVYNKNDILNALYNSNLVNCNISHNKNLSKRLSDTESTNNYEINGLKNRNINNNIGINSFHSSHTNIFSSVNNKSLNNNNNNYYKTTLTDKNESLYDIIDNSTKREYEMLKEHEDIILGLNINNNINNRNVCEVKEEIEENITYNTINSNNNSKNHTNSHYNNRIEHFNINELRNKEVNEINSGDVLSRKSNSKDFTISDNNDVHDKRKYLREQSCQSTDFINPIQTSPNKISAEYKNIFNQSSINNINNFDVGNKTIQRKSTAVYRSNFSYHKLFNAQKRSSQLKKALNNKDAEDSNLHLIHIKEAINKNKKSLLKSISVINKSEKDSNSNSINASNDYNVNTNYNANMNLMNNKFKKKKKKKSLSKMKTQQKLNVNTNTIRPFTSKTKIHINLNNNNDKDKSNHNLPFSKFKLQKPILLTNTYKNSANVVNNNLIKSHKLKNKDHSIYFENLSNKKNALNNNDSDSDNSEDKFQACVTNTNTYLNTEYSRPFTSIGNKSHYFLKNNNTHLINSQLHHNYYNNECLASNKGNARNYLAKGNNIDLSKKDNNIEDNKPNRNDNKINNPDASLGKWFNNQEFIRINNKETILSKKNTINTENNPYYNEIEENNIIQRNRINKNAISINSNSDNFTDINIQTDRVLDTLPKQNNESSIKKSSIKNNTEKSKNYIINNLISSTSFLNNRPKSSFLNNNMLKSSFKNKLENNTISNKTNTITNNTISSLRIKSKKELRQLELNKIREQAIKKRLEEDKLRSDHALLPKAVIENKLKDYTNKINKVELDDISPLVQIYTETTDINTNSKISNSNSNSNSNSKILSNLNKIYKQSSQEAYNKSLSKKGLKDKKKDKQYKIIKQDIDINRSVLPLFTIKNQFFGFESKNKESRKEITQNEMNKYISDLETISNFKNRVRSNYKKRNDDNTKYNKTKYNTGVFDIPLLNDKEY